MDQDKRKPPIINGKPPRTAPEGMSRHFTVMNPEYRQQPPLQFGFVQQMPISFTRAVYDDGSAMPFQDQQVRDERAKAALVLEDPGEPATSKTVQTVKGIGYFLLIALVAGGVGYIFFKLRK
jgi:hypothetical protein